MRSRVLAFLKLLAINGLVFFVLFNLVYWSLPVARLLLGRSETYESLRYPNAQLPNYANADWAVKHFQEYKIALAADRTDFKSYFGWRREPFSGKTINIEGPIGQRRTVNNGNAGAKKAYFFGGSTMWGIGANDEGTIPSQFAALTGMHSENFGEMGYTAHQGLTLLIEVLQAGHRPDLVVFYDGINEPAIKCVTELTPTSHMLESRIDIMLKHPPPAAVSFEHYLAPLWHMAGRVKGALTRTIGTRPEGFNCHRDPDKAAKIADNLVRDWQMAKLIAESYGAKFIGILQPAIYFSRTRRDHLEDVPALMREQFETVYPLIKRRMAEVGGFEDLTSVLDVDDYVYVDFAHLSPNGNKLVAARIAELARSLDFGK